VTDEKILASVKKALESSPARKFKESVEIAFNLKDIDLSIPKNRVDMEIRLPKGRGKVLKVAIFGSSELAEKAKKSADTIFKPEDIEELAKDKKRLRRVANDHGFFIAEAGLMPIIGKNLGVVLGPRGKMPKPIPPGADPASIITSMRETVRIRSKDRLTFHAVVGTREMKPEDLAENIETIVSRLEKHFEKGRQNIRSAFVKTSMGPAVRLQL
jgi:large subunit ribosomal protein L1